VFTRETHFPFKLSIPTLRREIPVLNCNDRAADYPVQGTVLTVQIKEDEYLDDFLNLLLEVCMIIVCIVYLH